MTSLVCHGGVGEIGGNKILLKFKRGSIFLDFGLSYKDEALFFEEFLQPRSACKIHDLLKLDLLPKIHGIYRKDAFCPYGFEDHDIPGKTLWKTDLKSFEESVEANSWHPDAVFVSHAHLDHCGYVPYLGNIPLVCSETTKTLLTAISEIGNLDGFDKELTFIKKRKMSSYGSSSYFPGDLKIESEKDPQNRRFNTLNHEGFVSTKNELTITGYNVGHSIPGSMACLVESDDSQILYTGDLRFHGRSGSDLRKELTALKPDIMICEGTRIHEKVPDNEKQVEEDLADLFSNSDGLAMVGFAWKDIERYETVRVAAIKSERIPVFDPRLAYLLARLGRSVYREEAKVFLERCDCMLYSPGDYVRSKHKIGEMPISDWDKTCDSKSVDVTHLKNGVSALEIMKNPQSYVLHLDYFRFKNMLDLEPPEGSVFVRARSEPFNPREELSEERMKRWLEHFGLNVENNYDPYQIHASGHASGLEIQEMINEIKPRILVPVHTEKPNLFKNPAGNVKIPKKGLEIKL